MQTSKMESFVTIVNRWKLLTVTAMLSILEIYGGPVYTSVIIIIPHCWFVIWIM